MINIKAVPSTMTYNFTNDYSSIIIRGGILQFYANMVLPWIYTKNVSYHNIRTSLLYPDAIVIDRFDSNIIDSAIGYCCKIDSMFTFHATHDIYIRNIRMVNIF